VILVSGALHCVDKHARSAPLVFLMSLVQIRINLAMHVPLITSTDLFAQHRHDCYLRCTTAVYPDVFYYVHRACNFIDVHKQMRQMEKTSESIVEVLEADIQACNSKLDTTAAEVRDQHYLSLRTTYKSSCTVPYMCMYARATVLLERV
jgi:hypothetical protein